MLRLLTGVVLLVAFTTAAAPAPSPEARTAAYLESIRTDQTRLPVFLAALPKGGDLHHHLTGAIYAESYIEYAAEDGDCFDATFTIVPPPCDATKGLSPASRALYDYAYRNQTIDQLSARNYAPTAGDTSILVHFFKTFFKFDLVTHTPHWGEMLAEVVHRAAYQHEVYLETMMAPDDVKSVPIGEKVGWDDDFVKLRAKMDAAGIPALVVEARKNLDDMEAGERKIFGCGGPAPDAGCAMTVRYQNIILRALDKQAVFAQLQTAFELAAVDPRVVAVNPVQPQEDYTPMKDFELQLRMFAFFHSIYPKVHIDMHAGELGLGVMRPEEMYSPSHIRDSILIGHAERIGHGLDVLYERDPEGLLKMMAQRHILVEDPIYIHELVGPRLIGEDVLPIYLRAGVPVSLATDDEGGDRSNLTQTFDRAVRGYHIGYLGLKKMVRASLEHAFLPGADLWTSLDTFTGMAPACAGQPATAVPASAACRAFLASSQKATVEWREEVAFAAFEKQF